ncbi:MAG TPA: sigma-70 family RNA polymerase sigma factor [Gaiellaceae bacterium]|jgi:RNA polymerase sigma-70 factor (ECF subfamily)
MRGKGASLAAIEAVYREGFERFATVAVAIVGSQAAARDAVQEAFVLAVRQRDRFRGDGSLEGWLWRTVVNEARTQRRRASARPRLEGEAGRRWLDIDPEPGLDGEIGALVALLPERQRIAVFLRYYADLSYEQIAEALGISKGTVAATLSTAHRTLRLQLEEVVPWTSR